MNLADSEKIAQRDAPVFSPDISQAQLFLKALRCADGITFQTFAEGSQSSTKKHVARIRHGTFDQHAGELASLNQQGAGVFVMVNAGDLKGRAAENVTRVRALFVDLDGAPIEPVLNALLKPHIVAESSAGRFHAYWIVSDCPLEEFSSLQRQLAQKFGGDCVVHDLPRVMRLPGFWHRKSAPFLTRIDSVNDGAPYQLAQIRDVLLSSSNGAAFQNDAFISGIKQAPDPSRVCRDGERTQHLIRLAGSWLGQGLPLVDVIERARVWNANNAPPMGDDRIVATCESISRTHARKQAGEKQACEAWGDPFLFDESETPDIPADRLPGVCGEFAAALAEATETPEAMAVFTILGAVSAALAKRFVVSPKPGWNEPVNLYVLIALPPANNKSLVLKECTAPLLEWEIEQAAAGGVEKKRLVAERKNQEKLIESYRAKAVRAKDVGERTRLFAEVVELETKLPEIKPLPQVFASDATPESLTATVHNQGGRFAIFSDEGGIVQTQSGLYTGGEANLDIILKGIDGGHVRVLRKDRDLSLNPYLTLVLAVQPKIVQNMAGKRALQGNGYLERFLYILPKSSLGYRKHNTPPIPGPVRAAYSKTLRSLIEIGPALDVHGKERPRVLELAPSALGLWREFQTVIEAQLRPGALLDNLLGWGGKISGYALRIAGLLHVMEHGEANRVISEETMKSSIAISLLAVKHAVATFGYMGIDRANEDAQAVLGWVKVGRLDRFAQTKCLTAHKGRFTKVTRLTEALKVLADRAIIRGPFQETTTPGKRATMYFEVNPAVFGVKT